MLTDYLQIVENRFETVAKWKILFGTVTLTTGALYLHDFIHNKDGKKRKNKKRFIYIVSFVSRRV